MPGQSGWEHYAHDADIGVRGFGSTMAEAFEQAAVALTAVVVDPDAVAAIRAVDIERDAPEPDLLLAEWLNAIVYEMAVGRMVFGRFAVSIDATRLHARAWGEPVDVARHRPKVEVKGATFTTLRVAREASGRWIAQTVVDV